MTLSIGLTGLQAAQTDLDTIGNNIANVGTDGFKASTPHFSSLYGASLSGATGGAVPGQGVLTNSLSQLFTEGTITQSGNPLDVAINGNGFFEVQTNGGLAYSRDGSLLLDSNGTITNSAGAAVLGFSAVASGSNGTAVGPIGPIRISQANLTPTATSNLTMDVNLPSTDRQIDTTTTPFNIANAASYNESTTTTVYDSLGTPSTLTTYFTQVSGSGSPPQWQTHWGLSSTTGSLIASGAGGALTFNSSGALTAGSGTITATPPNGAAQLSITQKFTGTTLSNLPFAVTSIDNNGNGGGQFSGLQISANGNIVAQYSNGATKLMGTIALASFVNPQGLVAVQGNNWMASAASGPAVTNAPGVAGLGTLEAGAREGSNVDLSTQLVNLIVAQQAYQANVQGINIDQQDVQRLLQLQ
jgi:flagellar hook protein FlgE